MARSNNGFRHRVAQIKEQLTSQPRNCNFLMMPIEVIINEELSPWEKIILSEIISLDIPGNNYRGCYASNEYLSWCCGNDVRKVERYIKRLRDLGYIYTTRMEGKVRVMKVNEKKVYGEKANSARLPGKRSG